MSVQRRHPDWIKVRWPAGGTFAETRRVVKELGLHTVCEEAQCPNIGECWGQRSATFMLLGDVCTRNCGYCAVQHGRPVAVDPTEPQRVAEASARLSLRHVVVTSVDRDDLPDGGASHFATTARAIEKLLPDCTIEVLTPDFKGHQQAIDIVVDSPISVFNHNTETVPRLYRRVRPGGDYQRTLEVLRRAKGRREGLLVKSGIMLGLGEELPEILVVVRDLVDAGCDILTLGQYLQPTRQHLPVHRYVPPDEFASLKVEARRMGLAHVESGPLVRSSYRAWEHVKSC